MTTNARSSKIASRNSKIRGDELLSRLSAIDWTVSDFARLIGKTRETVDNYVDEVTPIPVSVELNLEYVERFPDELMARPELQTGKLQSRRRRRALRAIGAETTEISAREFKRLHA